ncbi:MAG: endonuclease/exonuclease/phosphatase family protein [Treponema sp.]|jgi:hypothetical protein|nr:endonuclease/exonuclease/phosphatase family protein [Treponema sp.]
MNTKHIRCLIGALLLSSCMLYAAEEGAEVVSAEELSAGEAPAPVSVWSFNIQTFGATKMARPSVKEVLADVLSRADLCAIQEVRSSKSTAPMDQLMALLPSGRESVLGEPEGRSSYKEQYWLIYDSAKWTVLASAVYPDPGDLFVREPMGFYLRAGDFDCILLDNHIAPDDAAAEIAALPAAAAWFAELWDESDIIIVGDFNADGSYYNEDALADVFPPGDWLIIIGNDVDTTVASSSNTYDRIIISASAVEDYTGDCGVFRFDEEEGFADLGILANRVSDHYPIWALFYVDRDTD